MSNHWLAILPLVVFLAQDADAQIRRRVSLAGTTGGGGETAVAILDTGSTGYQNWATTTVSTITVTAGTNRVGLAFWGNYYNEVTIACDSIRWGSTKMTRVNYSDGSGSMTAQIFYIINPPTGETTVTQYGASAFGSLMTMTFSGANQTTPIEANVVANASASSISNNISSATNHLVVDMITSSVAAGAPGAGQTTRKSADASGLEWGRVSTEAGASTVTMSWSLASSGTVAQIIVSIAN